MPLIKSGSRAAVSQNRYSIRDTDLAYAAGIIDGEGSISASHSSKCAKNVRIILNVAMCDPSAVVFLQQTFGGNLRREKRMTKSGRPIYSWSLYCRKAASVLQLILPYLRIKRQRAADAIKLALMMRRVQESHKAIINEEEINLRIALAAKIKAENLASNGRAVRYAIN